MRDIAAEIKAMEAFAEDMGRALRSAQEELEVERECYEHLLINAEIFGGLGDDAMADAYYIDAREVAGHVRSLEEDAAIARIFAIAARERLVELHTESMQERYTTFVMAEIILEQALAQRGWEFQENERQREHYLAEWEAAYDAQDFKGAAYWWTFIEANDEIGLDIYKEELALRQNLAEVREEKDRLGHWLTVSK